MVAFAYVGHIEASVLKSHNLLNIYVRCNIII